MTATALKAARTRAAVGTTVGPDPHLEEAVAGPMAVAQHRPIGITRTRALGAGTEANHTAAEQPIAVLGRPKAISPPSCHVDPLLVAVVKARRRVAGATPEIPREAAECLRHPR